MWSSFYCTDSKLLLLRIQPIMTWIFIVCLLLPSGPVGQSGAPDLRQATSTLASTLYDLMGQGLLEKATTEPSMTQRLIQILQGMVE